MKGKVHLFCVMLACSLVTNQAAAQSTAFFYQGRLIFGESPASGAYDFRFKLYFDALGSNQTGGAYLTNGVSVNGGLFATLLDFGPGIFNGSNYWLEVDVKTNNAGIYTVLSPLQQITPTPYAIFAGSADNLSGTLPVAQLSGTIPFPQLPSGVLTNNQSGVTVSGSFIGNGVGLTNLQYANLAGNLPITSTLEAGSSFAAVSNAFGKGGAIWFQPGDYYNMSNIIPVSDTFLIGPGATLHFSSNCTGVFIDCGTNVSNFSAKGIRLTGDAFANFASSSFITPFPGSAGNFEPWYIGMAPGTFTNRSGLRVNGAGGGMIEDVTVDGFGAYGFIFVSVNTAPESVKTIFAGDIAVSNYCGGALWSWPWDWTTPGSSSGWVSANDENQCITGCRFCANGIGLYASAGNHNITGCNISGNWVGLYAGNGYNAAHGCVTGNTINHNEFGSVVYDSKESIVGNTMLDNGGYLFDSCSYAVFANNQISGDGSAVNITVTNSQASPMGQVTICDNWYEGNFSGGVVTNFNLGPGHSGNVLWYNNQTSSGTAFDSDGTPASMVNQSGNPAGLTNTFNGSALPDITIHATGVTNTTRVYGTAQLSVQSGSFTNFNAFGTAVLTNVNVSGIFTYSLGPGASIKGPGGLSGFIIFQ